MNLDTTREYGQLSLKPGTLEPLLENCMARKVLRRFQTKHFVSSFITVYLDHIFSL